MFRGSHVTRVDEKGRLKVPADYKRELPDEAQFYITSTDGRRAQLYPMKEWEKKEEVLARLPFTSAVRRKFVDVTSYYGQQVQMDGQGRLTLPQILRESARLGGDVAVIGAQGILEVVNHEEFKAQIEAAPLTDDDMAALAAFGI